MSASATNCANYKVSPILNTSAGSGQFGANRYLIPFQIYSFNNQGTSTQEAINGSSGPGSTQDSLIGSINDFTLSSSSSAGNYLYTLNSNNSQWSWISSINVVWIANTTTAPTYEEWRIVINAQSNYNSGSTRGVTILFRFGNGTEYGTVFPLYIAQNDNNNDPQKKDNCTPGW